MHIGRTLLSSLAGIGLALLAGRGGAPDAVKNGLIRPTTGTMTGVGMPSATTGSGSTACEAWCGISEGRRTSTARGLVASLRRKHFLCSVMS